jgi:hypothetical protein
MHVKRRVLFFVYQRTVFADAYRTATRLKATADYDPTFLVAWGTSALVQGDIDRCGRDGIACVTEEEVLGPQPRPEEPPAAAVKAIEIRSFAHRCVLFAKYRTLWLVMQFRRLVMLALLRTATFLTPRSAILLIGRVAARRLAKHSAKTHRLPALIERWLIISDKTKTIRSFEARYETVLRKLQPDILCLSEDIPGPLTAPLIKVARRLGIPSVIVPFTIPNPREAIEAAFSESPDHLQLPDLLADRLAIEMFPRWALTYKNRMLLRLRGNLAIACEQAGIAPPSPWVVNSGFADRIAVESEQMLAIYRNLGFPAHQLSLTGSATDDMLHEAIGRRESRKRSLYAELGLREDFPLLLTSLVPNQLQSPVPFCEFERYEAVLEFWVSALAKWRHRYNIVLKVNPRTPWQDFLYLEKFGAKVAPVDTIDLMPLAEIYVASISSTLRWAIACGIPSVNYDVYHYRYGDYLGASGVVHVETKGDFVTAIDRLAGDDAYRDEARERQLAQAGSWGHLDGRATERLVALFEELRLDRTDAAQVDARHLGLPLTARQV